MSQEVINLSGGLTVHCGSFDFPDDAQHPIRIELIGLMIRCVTDRLKEYNWLTRLICYKSYRCNLLILRQEVEEAKRIALVLAERTNKAQGIANKEQSTLDSRVAFDLKQLTMLETVVAEASDFV